MPRAARPVADGLLYHTLTRGNNRADICFAPKDYLTFLKALEQTQKRYPFRLFGYCLMTNHFHLLLAPEPGQVISRILQSLTVAHTWHYHQSQGSSGHLSQGRFKNPPTMFKSAPVVAFNKRGRADPVDDPHVL